MKAGIAARGQGPTGNTSPTDPAGTITEQQRWNGLAAPAMEMGRAHSPAPQQPTALEPGIGPGGFHTGHAWPCGHVPNIPDHPTNSILSQHAQHRLL